MIHLLCMAKLLHLCRRTYSLQSQDTPNRFGVTSICLQVAIFQNDVSVCNRPEKRITLNGSEVKCYLKAKRKKNNKNLAGFVRSNFALRLILVYSNIVRTSEMLLTYDLRTRNTDPHFHFVSCYKKHF